MKLLLFIIILAFFSCQNRENPYAKLNAWQCDSLLKHTVLSSGERALVILQYARLHTQGRGPVGAMTSAKQDSCLNMLLEVMHLAPANLQAELKITILPFYLSKLTLHDPKINRTIRRIMSDIENSTLTPEQEGWYLNYKAQYYTIQRSPHEAFLLCEQARKKFQENQDKQGEFNILSQMALLHLIQKDYTTAIRYCDSAQNLQDYTPPLVDQQRLYSQYSVLYANIGEYDKAIQARRLSGTDTIRNSSLANLYIASGQYNKALHIIEQQCLNQKENPFRKNYYLRSKAEIYEATGQYEKASALREEAIRSAETMSCDIRKKHPELPGIPVAFASIYANQAKWEWQKGNRMKAIQLLQKAEMLTLRSDIITKENIRILEQLTQYYRETGNFRSALNTNLRRDSLENLLIRLNTPKDYRDILLEQEIEILNATIDKQKTELRTTRNIRAYQYLSVSLLAIGIILFVLYNQNLRKKKKRKS